MKKNVEKLRRERFSLMQLKTDDKGQEYLSYTAFGGMAVRDYSPWTIKEYKETMGV